MNLNFFEERLLHELRTVADETTPVPAADSQPGRLQPSYRWVGIAAAAAVLAGATTLLPSSTPPAWSVNKDDGGTVTVTVRRVQDLPDMQAELIRQGVNATVTGVPWQQMCTPGRYREAPVSRGEQIASVESGDGRITVTLPKGLVRDGQTLVLDIGQDPDHNAAFVAFGVAAGAVGSCVLQDIPAEPGNGPAGGSQTVEQGNP